jgi:hypothetical protein
VLPYPFAALILQCSAVYPRTYDPSFATGACVLAIVFASTFAVIFPLVAPAVVLLLLLTLVGWQFYFTPPLHFFNDPTAHRFLVGYVYGRTHSQTGGVLQIWLLRRFGTLLSFQPLLLGLILLSRKFWAEGGALVGVAVALIIFVEVYTGLKSRQPGRSSLSAITRDCLDTFADTAKDRGRHSKNGIDDESMSLVNSGAPGATRTRGSMASVLEMMSLTLAVMPSSSRRKGPVPLRE